MEEIKIMIAVLSILLERGTINEEIFSESVRKIEEKLIENRV